ncbi:hypothetical protein GCM10022235_18460 [Kribbella ginsengisoli]|uniref:Uncharacterized protein n=1 Tax=Kribbella ginsengisoli TaxID=363865 RepID=A0ABP6WKF5_9ACTN
MPWLSPYGRPEVGRPVASSGSIERTALVTPSAIAWPSGRESLAETGWDSLVASEDVVVGSAWLHTVACVTVAGTPGAAVDGRAESDAVTSDTELRASSGTVAESRTKLPNRWTASVNRPVRDSS